MSLLPILDYRYIVVFEKQPTEFRRLRGALDFIRRKVRQPGAQYSVVIGDSIKTYDTMDEAIARVKPFLRKRKLGKRAKIHAVKDGARVATVVVHVAAIRLQPADTPGVPNIDAVVAAVDEFWPKRRYAGICVCKPSSDHRDCAAVDWFDTWPAMEAAARYFVGNHDTYGVKYLILGATIWSDSYGFVPRRYTGTYHSHVHVSVYGGVAGSAC